MNNQPVYRKNQIQTLILLLKVLELKSHEDNFFELVLFLARYSFLFENPQNSVNSCTSEVPQIYTEQAFSDWSMKYTDPDGRKQILAQKIFTKALNFAVIHNESAANYIQHHTNVAITRNVYEGKEIHATWPKYNYDATETYYEDNLSVEVCGIPLNNIQVQSTADHPDGIDDSLPIGKGKADVGVSGATKAFIKDTLLFDSQKGDFLHSPIQDGAKPGGEGCVVTEKEADTREVMNILRNDLGIKNGKDQVNYSVKDSNWLRNNYRKGNLDE